MLVLSRKIDQAVVVGGEGRFEDILKVTVLGIRGGIVRLGFKTNRDVPVHREEVWLQISADRAREPPGGSAGRTASSGADGNAPVLPEREMEGARNHRRSGRKNMKQKGL